MNQEFMRELILGAGVVQAGIVGVNFLLPARLRVGEKLQGTPAFVRQIFYVHWIYIVIVVGMFAAVCLGFARELAAGNGLGRFLATFLAGFWGLRVGLQLFYYDRALRREHRGLDLLYVGSLVALTAIFVAAALGLGR